MAEPVNTPIPASTPRSASPILGLKSPLSPTKFSTLTITPRVLHILGEQQEPETILRKRCQVIPAKVSSRDQVLEGLKSQQWGDFEAVIAEHVRLDAPLVAMLPSNVKVVVGDADPVALRDKGIVHVEKGHNGSISLLGLLDVKTDSSSS